MFIRKQTYHFHGLLLLLFCIAVLAGCGPNRIDANVETDSTGKEPLDFPEITAGVGHTCLLTNSGRVECWGMNQFGQLGGDKVAFSLLEFAPNLGEQYPSSWVKANVRGLTRKVTAISAGFYHTCALDDGGGVYCWGLNDFGQLGDGTTSQRNIAVGVLGLESGVISIAAGAKHTCALLNSGAVNCWGDNSEGQLGNGSIQNSLLPIKVDTLSSSIEQLTAGVVFSCALDKDGSVFCWGNGQDGRFGKTDVENYRIPIKLEDLKEPLEVIAAGDYHLCGRTASNTVICWGALSSEFSSSPHHPLAVNGIPEGAVQLVAGSGFSCSLTTTDNVKCWGDNFFGQLGNGTYLGSFDAGTAMNLTANVLKIGAGSVHACALLFGGDVLCWGDCSAGQCGDSSISWNWNTYTHHIYHFSLDYPPEWNVHEIPGPDFTASIDQVLFSRPGFQPSQSGARAEISMIITKEDPSPKWESRYFENYQKGRIQLRNIEAVKITGMNKESQFSETVIIIQVGNFFIQCLPNNSPEAIKYFDQVMFTFNVDS